MAKAINRKVPRIVSTLCYLGYASGLLGLIFVFSPQIKNLGAGYPALFGMIVALRFISYVGVSHMKKWGVHLLLGVFFADLILGIIIDRFSPGNIIIGALSLVFFIGYYKKMDENL